MSDDVIERPIRDEKGRLLPGTRLPGAGRPAYTYDRKAVAAICKERGYHPIHHLIDIATNPDASLYVQKDCASEIASFLMPKMKTVSIGNDDGSGGTIHISWDTPASTEVNTAPPKPDPAARRFKHAMEDATATVIDAVLTDDDKD